MFPDRRLEAQVNNPEQAQVLGLVILIFASLVNWMLCVRNYCHITFISVPDSVNASPGLKEELCTLASRLAGGATVHHTLGTRSLYLMIVVIGWKIGTAWMFGASVILVPWFLYHDVAL